jgi:hypothetical protein
MVVLSIPTQNSAMAPADHRDLAEILLASRGPRVAAAVRKAMVKSLEMMVSHSATSPSKNIMVYRVTLGVVQGVSRG